MYNHYQELTLPEATAKKLLEIASLLHFSSVGLEGRVLSL